jgi:hypothetical protein
MNWSVGNADVVSAFWTVAGDGGTTGLSAALAVVANTELRITAATDKAEAPAYMRRLGICIVILSDSLSFCFPVLSDMEDTSYSFIYRS